MPPTTRSGGTPASEKVYTSGAKAPQLHQTRFPTRRTTLRGYGRKNPRRKILQSREASPDVQTKSSPRQNTLTQMQWADPTHIELVNDEEEKDRPVKKRRKTEGDVPSSPPKSSYHTQTLTQMGSFNSKMGDDFVIIESSDNEDAAPAPAPLKAGEASSSGPRTPSARRIRTEIPSSQDSPQTPFLARYSPLQTRSPLKDKSTNVQSPHRRVLELAKPFSASKRSRTLPVEDSYETSASRSPASSVENHSPAKPHSQHPKAVRFVTPSAAAASQAPSERAPLADITEDVQEESESADETPASPSPMPRRTSVPDREIADSDDDFELWDDNDGHQSDDDAYGAVGAETQRLVEEIVSSSEKQASGEQPTPTPPLAHSETSNDHNPQSSTMATAPGQSSSFSEVATVRLSSPPQILPRQPPALVARSSEATEAQSLEDLIGPPSSGFPATQAKTQHATQGVESQRIPMDDIRAMGPQTDRSDIFISIHPQHVENIVSGTKNHEFRNYKIPNLVTRMWIYTTAPASELRYMARISPAKVPGEIGDDGGVGNADFDANKTVAKFAYQLLDVYELNNPVSLSEAKEHGWLAGPPQKYNYVPPGVVGHLMANLRCSIFGNDEDDEDEEDVVVPLPSSAPQFTVSQEVTNQLLSEATQHPSDPVMPSDPVVPADPVYIVPSSQEAERGVIRSQRASTSTFKRPDHPASTPYRRPANPTPSRGVRPSQATTVSQVSSPAVSPTKRTTRSQARAAPSVHGLSDDESSLPPASSSYQLRSSQLLSKSQMLPDSLRSHDMSIGDEVDIIYDSEADMDEF
ncbi:hypothetical protein F5X68DRAFT_155000 [Plectosphaerella plurivora]|uniref:Uncharacterized protein n=1 Tax=Plectosphaerella plurivora TaxID=936078 RepID=A0A9P8V735_9PEZI|nr:hypothetical protein F5X68DRAFT_155000 [Plectosphaerella plurivora]